MGLILKISEFSLKIILLSVCTICLYNSLKKLVGDDKSFQYYFYLLFYVFYVFPVALQLCFPSHEYIIFWRANEAMGQPIPNIIYDIFVITFSLLIIRTGKRNKLKNGCELECNRMIVRVCTLVIITVFAMTLAMNGISPLISYASGYVNESLNINESLIGCGIICYLVLLGHKKYISKIHLISMTMLVIGFMWVVGKRYILAETIIMGIYVLSITGIIQGKKFLKYLIFGGTSVIAFCVIYGIVLKGNFNSFVDYFMVDMSRQYTLIYQFFCQMSGKEISVGKYDAVLWLIGWWIPRSVWPDKPYPFVNQLTYSLVSTSTVPSGENMGWATTCGVFSDLFDSFSYFGLVLAMFLFISLFKMINSNKKPHFKILMMYLTVKLLTVQISSSIIQIVLSFVLFLLCDKFDEIQKKRKQILLDKENI